MSFERTLRAHGTKSNSQKTGNASNTLFECCAKLFRKTNELRGVSSIAAIGTAESRALPDRNLPQNTKSAAMAALLRLSDCYIQSSRLKGVIVPCFGTLYSEQAEQLSPNQALDGA